MRMKRETTNRGFYRFTFTDRYQKECSIQESSLATEACIWLGINDANPQIMASQSGRFGVSTEETCGWIPYPVPDDVSFDTRMHLTRKQAKHLGEMLIRFAETGELSK